MPGSTAAKLLDTPTAIWKTVTKTGGLDLRYHSDMDEDVIQSLLKALGADASKTIESAISDPSLTVESFVGALLEALNPFSAMLSDLLAMFEQAGAKRTDHSLQIDFDFGNAPKLSFDLRQFRDWIEKVERVRELVRVRRWSSSDLWHLASALRINDKLRLSTPADRWMGDYVNFWWPEFDLPRPVSGDVALDESLSKCFDVWLTVVHETSKLGPNRRALHERASRTDDLREEGEGNWSMRFLAEMDRDGWAGSVASGMHRVALQASSLLEPDRREFIDQSIRSIEELFAHVPSMTIEEENIRRVLVEFLNLPIWQQRHELYSAWIMTLIADALSDRELRFHLDDGLLSFSFGGSHIATADATTPRLHVWAELCSPLQEPRRLSGRKRIQPDYTLITDPMTSLNSAVVVVECKQYRRFSKKNFSNAVIDYAAGRPNAQIVLAAYGPVRDDFLTSLSPDVADRITLLGHLRPGDADTRLRFRHVVRNAITNRLPASESDTPRVPVAQSDADALKSVKLSWGATPADLDLHFGVWYRGEWARIDFGSQGNTNDYPWAELDRDVRGGYGPETITVARLLEATYRCYVDNFSRQPALSSSGAKVIIAQRDSEIRLVCPRTGSGRFWHVFDFDAVAQRLIIVNVIVDGDPTQVLAAPSH